MMLLTGDLELLGQDGQELLQHQQVQDLLLACVSGLGFTDGRAPGAGSGPAGSRGTLVAEVPNCCLKISGQEAGSLEG